MATLSALTVDWPHAAARGGVVAVALAIWFLTQKLIATKEVPGEGIGDRVHQATARWHAFFVAHPRATNVCLGLSSFFIDLIGLALIGVSVFGGTFAPFLAVMLVFALRQASQYACSLPRPPGVLWHDPGFPTLLVTYKVSNDFFFSGHTAIAVLGAAEAVRMAPPWLAWAAVVVAAGEALLVLVLRAHWTMDVITGILAAILASDLGHRLAPALDAWMR